MRDENPKRRLRVFAFFVSLPCHVRHPAHRTLPGRHSDAPSYLGHPGRGIRRLAVRNRRDDRQRRPAHDRPGARYLVGRLDLDRQCLPARDHGLAALVLGPRRTDRLPPGLHRRTGPLHRRLGRLRPLRIAADPRADPRHAGIRRGGRHVDQYDAHPHHLPQGTARARHGNQRHGRSRLVSGRAYPGRRHPLGRRLAVALRREHPRRADRPHAQLALPARKPGPGPRRKVQLARRRDERPDFRTDDVFHRGILARA